MTVRCVLLLVCVVTGLLSGTVSGAPDEGSGAGKLANGLSIVVDDSGNSDEPAAFWVVAHKGAADQRDNERGAAIVAARALVLELEAQGFDLAQLTGLTLEEVMGGNAFGISTQHMVLRLEVDDEADIGSALGAARVMLSGFDPSDELVERAIALVLKQAHERREQSDELDARADWMVELFSGGPLSRLSLPRIEDLESLSAERVRAFIDRSWRVSDATLLVVGDQPYETLVGESLDTFGEIAAPERDAERERVLDLEDVEGRVVTRSSQREGNAIHALVWFDPEMGGLSDEAAARARIAVAGEAARARVSSRARERLGESVIDAGAQFGVIADGVSYAQLIVRLDPGRWEESLTTLVAEAQLLRAEGVNERELERAREIVRREWSTQKTFLESGGNAARARLRAFFVEKGEIDTDPVAWLGEVVASIDRVSAEDVNAELEETFGRHDPGVVVFERGVSAPDPGTVSVLVENTVEDWAGHGGDRVDELGVDSVLDVSPGGGRPREIRIHHGSSIVSCRLGNGAWAHHHEMVDPRDPGRVLLSVYLDFGGVDGGVVSGSAAPVINAIRDARLRRRLDEEVHSFKELHGIEHLVEVDARGLSVQISADADSIEHAAEFAYALLTDLRLDGVSSAPEPLVGPMELGVATALRAIDRSGYLGVAPIRWWVERLNGSRIEIGVSGDIDAERSLGVVSEVFGALPNTPEDPEIDERQGGGLRDGRFTASVSSQGARPGVVQGFTGCDPDDVFQTRALVLGGLVLGERVEILGVGDRSYGSAIVFRAADAATVVLARAECDQDEIDSVSRALSEQIDQCADLAMTPDEVDRARERILELLDVTMPTYRFWSTRLSCLGASRQSIDDLWSIREMYERLTAADVNRVYRLWHAQGARFEVRLEDPQD